ncbi:hypothetical protein BUALT_Bualt03G0068900 [Buddleja alternifolia]|uniref:Apple domain-containing protein n=1 Tax=Buddleja alternifolia TaxID=168488 RepID=A0AAV6XYF8_9LAMI|nr:hypothetical protein BUALT_Bualt03G0068900 [Buddleja alternifolia]
MWIDELKEWKLTQSHPVGECGRYNHCGAFGICNEVDLQKCGCIEGFVANDSDEWSRRNWSSGCVRRRKLQCEEENNSLEGEEGGNKDGFVQIERVKFPNFVGSEDIKECEKMCLENCSCTAYAFDSGINCMIWNRDLVDVQQLGEGGSTLFVRLAHSELGDKNHGTKIVVITIVIVGTFFVCVLIWVIYSTSSPVLETSSTVISEASKLSDDQTSIPESSPTKVRKLDQDSNCLNIERDPGLRKAHMGLFDR